MTSAGTCASGQTTESSSSVLVILHQSPEEAQFGMGTPFSSLETAKVSARMVSVSARCMRGIAKQVERTLEVSSHPRRSSLVQHRYDANYYCVRSHVPLHTLQG